MNNLAGFLSPALPKLPPYALYYDYYYYFTTKNEMTANFDFSNRGHLPSFSFGAHCTPFFEYWYRGNCPLLRYIRGYTTHSILSNVQPRFSKIYTFFCIFFIISWVNKNEKQNGCRTQKV